MKYTVCVTSTEEDEVRLYRKLTIERARKICKRVARRGVKRFGGNFVHGNLGSRGGQFPRNYTEAVIGICATR